MWITAPEDSADQRDSIGTGAEERPEKRVPLFLLPRAWP